MLRFQTSVHGGSAAKLAPLPVTFEQALAALEQLDRLFIELDGSFVWTGATVEGEPWQVDGNLIDRGECLAYAELKGCCLTEQFDKLLTAFGWPESKLVFQLPRRGVILEEAEFRQQAASEAGAI